MTVNTDTHNSLKYRVSDYGMLSSNWYSYIHLTLSPPKLRNLMEDQAEIL